MAGKIFKRGFSADFTGIDGQMAAIEPDAGAVNLATNYEMSVGNSLRGRVGSQSSGAYGFFSIFPYRYTRTQDQYDIRYQVAAGVYPNQTPGLSTTKTTADGASLEKLIGINKQLWVLDTFTYTLTYVSGTYPFTWYSYVNGSNINLNIKANGTSILDTSLGDGITSTVTIYSLLGTIDALAQLAITRGTRGTCPPFAIANGAQTSTAAVATVYGATYTWTVNNTPHTFQVGDLISWINSSTGLLQGGFVLSTTATTITYVGPVGTVANGQILGYMGQYASNFPITTVATAASGNLSLVMPYWRYVPEGDGDFGHIYDSAYALWQSKASGSFYAPPVAENQLGNIYIAASSQLSAGTSTWANNLIRCDGTQVVRAGLPTPSLTAVLNGAGALTGTYKYKMFMRSYDAQGNIWDGPVSPVVSFTAAAQSINVTLTTPGYGTNTGVMVRSCYKHTTESPAAGASFYVDDSIAGVGNQAFIQPGDIVLLTDNTPQIAGLFADVGLATVIGTLRKTVCTDYTAQVAGISPTISSIKVADSSGYTINTNTRISTGLTAVVLRTVAGGNQYYTLAEVPITGLLSATQLYDNVTDTTLTTKAQYIEVPIGKEHNPPPPCTLVCSHQGGLVVARGPLTPNTVGFSTTDGLEYFPTASNSFDVPSTQTGFVTAIASDTIDRLAVCKEKAYYDVAGDLDGGAFSVNVKNEGDYGITSQASLVRVNNALVGLSKNGWVTIQDGFLDPYKFSDLNARIVNQNYQFAWATGVNDYFNRQYLCSIPQVTGEPVTYAIDYSRNKILTLDRSYATKLDPAGGMAMIGDTLYQLSGTSPYAVTRRLIRFNGNSPNVGDGDSFYDNTGAISYVMELQPINFGEPGLLKSPIRIRIWSLPNDYVVEGWVPFSLRVQGSANPLAQYIGSGVTKTDATVTFSAVTDILKDVKLVKCKTHFYIIRFTTNTAGTAPFITGFEIMFTENYEKEDFVK